MIDEHDKQVWENYAATDPYFSVLTWPKYRSDAFNDAAKADFFDTGFIDVDRVWNAIEGHFGIELRPQRALDYGCGVGRILLPLARRCESVVGVDIAKGMLDETHRNMEAGGAENFELRTVEEFVAAEDDTYDFVHSYMVLQHMELSVGYGIISTLLERLEDGGCGMIHVTYRSKGRPPRRMKRFETWVKARPPIKRIRQFLGKGEKRSMYMDMHAYRLRRVNGLLEKAGCTERFAVDTDHGFLGKMIYFRKGTSPAAS